jgi:hydrogenase maturation factor
MVYQYTNHDGTLTIGCQSNSTTTTIAANSSQAQIQAAYQSIAPFAECQRDVQAALDLLLDMNFDLKAFIRAGTSTTVTGTNVGTFLATICDNYRTIRASIAAATTLTQLNAININSGWPANP